MLTLVLLYLDSLYFVLFLVYLSFISISIIYSFLHMDTYTYYLFLILLHKGLS